MGSAAEPGWGAGGDAVVLPKDRDVHAPLILSAHLQAGMYALAERAADLVKEDWK